MCAVHTVSNVSLPWQLPKENREKLGSFQTRLVELQSEEATKGQEIAEKYNVIGVLGKGSQGTVFKGRDVTNEWRIVALKVLPKKLADKEIFFLQTTSPHPHIPTLLGSRSLGTDSAFEFSDRMLVMPFMPNGDLDHFINKNGAMTPEKVAYVGKQLLSAIAHLSSQNICHGDVKPHNILYNQNSDEIILSDFGSATNLNTKPHEKPKSSLYPLFYRPPEVLLSSPVWPWDKADVWAAGCSLYFIATKQRVFFANQFITLQQSQDERDLLSQIENMVGPLPKDKTASAHPEKKELFLAQDHVDITRVSDHWQNVQTPPISQGIADTQLASILSQMVQYERPSAAQLLLDPVFRDAERK